MRPASEPAVPGSGCTLSFAAVYDEVEALAERARAHGGGRVDGPADTPWNTRDLTTADPDGNTVIFTAARPPRLADTAFSEQMRQRSRQQSLDPDSRLPPCGNRGAWRGVAHSQQLVGRVRARLGEPVSLV